MDFLPPLHSEEEDRSFFATQTTEHQVFLAHRLNDLLVCFIVFDEEWVHHLYVLPACHKQGVGNHTRFFNRTLRQSHRGSAKPRAAGISKRERKMGFISQTIVSNTRIDRIVTLGKFGRAIKLPRGEGMNAVVSQAKSILGRLSKRHSIATPVKQTHNQYACVDSNSKFNKYYLEKIAMLSETSNKPKLETMISFSAHD